MNQTDLEHFLHGLDPETSEEIDRLLGGVNYLILYDLFNPFLRITLGRNDPMAEKKED